MCLAIPGKIKSVSGRQAEVEYPGETRMALLSGDDIKVGDYVMVQMGIIVKILTPEEAKESLKVWSDN